MIANSPISVRLASIRDLKAIWAIEEGSYATPWPRETFFVDITLNADAKYFVAVIDGRIVGFIGGWFKEGALHIVNVATDPQYRRRGVARHLMTFLLGLADDLKVERAFLEVRRSNTAAEQLYESLGFEVSGVKEMYYPDNLEDALVMTKELKHADSGD